MSFQLRRIIAEKISEYLKPDIKQHYALVNKIPNLLELRKSTDTDYPELHLSALKARNLFQNNYDYFKIFQQIARDIKYDLKYVRNISIEGLKNRNSKKLSCAPTIVFKLNPETFVKDTLNAMSSTTQLLDNVRQRKDKIIVEFSSPNIAKPFHVGHLRSTIIGNFIANLYKFLGNNVVKINYLGDWGTQYGLLQVGVQLSGMTKKEIEENPIENLFKAYVIANQAAKDDINISDQARKAFTQLEKGKSDLKEWERFRKHTVDELKTIYNRLGVEFDQYDWESQYSQRDIQNIVKELNEKNLLLNEIDGRKVVEIDDRRVPIIKSDGSTLYLVRDIAALVDRHNRYNFDKIFYVVDNSQTDHFKALFTVTNSLKKISAFQKEHIKFGRIKGMSTRQGNVIFLKNILDEAKNIMMEKQIQSPTTKLDIHNLDPNVADILGISAVIINDLKQRRQRDYEFSWDKAIQVNGDTGIKLQYTHCRLSSLLLKNQNIQMAEIADQHSFKEIEAINLIIEIGKFPEIILKTEESLEPCVLVNYLFSLSNTISKALKVLQIRNENEKHLQSQRLLLFSTSRLILKEGMKILGLKPLEKM